MIIAEQEGEIFLQPLNARPGKHKPRVVGLSVASKGRKGSTPPGLSRHSGLPRSGLVPTRSRNLVTASPTPSPL
ncbi:hypothetical protein E2C01_046922 [Portunus trituberculatus]|uniref:Uncharacterized protein n=1 Tax=Portunus trituberculatus TaxID=210409 RepID=A0A5B7G7G0_PORTR|nr:hypothetical protein [Portunus trituberculatus]